MEELERLRQRMADLERSEKECREKAERFQSFVEAASDRIWETDLEGVYTYVSPKVRDVLGYEPEEVVGRKPSDFMPAGEAERTAALIRAVAAGGAPFSGVENVNIHKDGRLVTLETSAVPLFDTSGNPCGGRGMDRDITTRKGAEDILDKERETFRAILENDPTGVALIGPDGAYRYVNPEFTRITGYTLQDVPSGSDWFHKAYPDPEYRKMVVDAWKEDRRGGGRNPVDREFTILRRDGETRIVDIRTTFLSDFSISVLRDITERKRAEEALRTSHQRVLDIIDFLPDATFVIDGERKVIAWNRAIEEMTGVRKEEIIGKGDYAYAVPFYGTPRPIVIDLVFDRDGESEKKYDYVVGEGDILLAEAYVPMTYQGRGAYLSGRASPLFDPEGNLVGAIESIRDISEQKRAEESLGRLNRELQAVGNCNQVLIRAEDEETILGDICRIICDEAGYRMAWVGYVEHDEARTVRPVAWAGVEVGYLSQANITWADTDFGQGPTGRAIRNGGSACIQDFLKEPLELPWRESALHRGYRSSIALPLKDEDRNVFGVLNIYSAVPNAFTPDEFRLLEDLAGDLSFGIMAVRNRTTRRQAEEALRESEERYRLIADHASDIIWTSDMNVRFTYVSPSVEGLLGWTAEEMKSLPLEKVAPPDSLGVVMQTLADEVAKAEKNSGETRPARRVEIRLYRKDGTTVWTEISARLVSDGNGIPKGIVGVTREITERREAEQALRESQGRLAKVVSAARDAIIMMDSQGRISLWNDSATEIFGYTRDEAKGRNLHEMLVPRGFKEKCHAGFSLFRESGAGPVVGRVTERIAINKEGEEIPVEVSVAPVRVGDEWHAVGVVRDIRERIQAEQALRISEATLKSVFSAAPVGIIIADRNRIPRWMNEAMLTITGYTMDEQKGIGAMLLYISDEEYDRVGRVMLDEIEEGKVGITDTRWVHKDGGVRDVHLRGAAIDPRDIEAGLVFTAVDVTRQKQAEQELQESEGKYRLVVENSLVGLGIIQDNVMSFANRRWHEIFGYEYDEAVGRVNPLEVVHPDDREKVDGYIRDRITGKQSSVEFEFRGRRKDGRIITVKVFGGSTVYRGRPAATSTVIDITRERNLESQLLQSQKMQALGMLAGGVAHDFNNILTTVTGYGTLLKMRIGEEETLQTYVNHILTASRKATDLTQSLLAFSRQQPLSLKPVDMNDMVRHTSRLLHRLLTEDVLLKTALAESDLIVMADATQIDQILFNLTTNARDAMPEGGSLTIETKALELDRESALAHGIGRPGGYALLAVSDTGTGMDEKTRERIFEPFFTTKEVGKGTGLGLSMVYGIVTQHNGFMTVSSAPGVGTSFYIYFPLTRKAPHAPGLVNDELQRGTETILLAEDGEDVRRLIKEVLRKYGYSVIEAVDGEDAVGKFTEHSDAIDLLILDSVMPRKNGRAAYDEIGRLSPGVKVLFMSGYTKDVVLDKGIEDRTFNFIAKPVTPAELLKKVRIVLDR